MANILIFGGGLQSLSIAQGLNSENNNIINLAERHAVGKLSNYISKFIPIDRIEDLDVDKIIDLTTINKIAVIIPTEDEYAEWLSKNKTIIESHSKTICAIVDIDLFRKVIDKQSLLNICAKNKIPHPETISIDSNEPENISKFNKFPALIKPNISNGSRGIVYVKNIDEYQNKIKGIIQEYGDVTLQEFIDNPYHYYNAMLYRYADGSFGYSVVTKITRFYPIKGGSSSFCTTIINDDIIAICKKLLNKIEWIGFADFDILEKAKGDYRIIEINPRVPASVHAAYISGINFGKMIVDDCLHQKQSTQIYTPGKQLRFLGLDIAWFLSSRNRFKTTPSWFKFFGKDLYYQEGGIKDWRAMTYSIWSGIKKQLSPSFRKAKSGMN